MRSDKEYTTHLIENHCYKSTEDRDNSERHSAMDMSNRSMTPKFQISKRSLSKSFSHRVKLQKLEQVKVPVDPRILKPDL